MAHAPAKWTPVVFEVRCHIAPLLAKATGLEVAKITADVLFTPSIRNGDVLKAVTVDPPTGFLPLQVRAVLNEDGLLLMPPTELTAALAALGDDVPPELAASAGGAPVRLYGNSPELDLVVPFGYTFAFSNVRINDQASNVQIVGGWFEAPSKSDVVIDLIDHMRATGQTAVAQLRGGATTVDGLTDAGTAGKTVLRADTASQIWDVLGGGGAVVDVFTANGTWTKRPGAVSVNVRVVGGGGSGAAGAKGPAGSALVGGGGGGSGGMSEATFLAADLPATVAVSVGKGGAAVAGQSANSTAGANGNPGGTTTFGSGSAIFLQGGRGGGGTGGGTAAGGAGGVTGGGMVNGSTGGAGSATGGPGGAASWSLGAASGGAGGGVTAAGVAGDGGVGGYSNTTGMGGAKGGSGAVGANGYVSAVKGPGGGGGGGGASVTGNGFAGGSGGGCGAGGGGGGAALNDKGTTGGGGAGGDGICIVTTHFAGSGGASGAAVPPPSTG